MVKHLVVVALLLAAAAPHAVAAQAKIGGVAITLPLPAGFCALSESQKDEKRILVASREEAAKGGNTLLGYAADCRELAEWHDPKNKRQLLDNLAHYQTLTSRADTSTSPEEIAKACADLRQQGKQIVAEQVAKRDAQVEAAVKSVKLGATEFLGILAEDATACYAAIVQKLRTEAGTDKTELRTFAMAVVKGKVVYAYRHTLYANAGTVTAQLAKLRTTIAALYAANR